MSVTRCYVHLILHKLFWDEQNGPSNTNAVVNVGDIGLKGKEEYLYSAFIQHSVSRRSDMDHTVLPANYTMPAFRS